MENSEESRRKYRKLSKTEVIEHFGEEFFEETESINKSIQNLQKSRQILIDDVNTLPTLFQMVLRSRKEIRKTIKDLKDSFAEKGIKFETWHLTIYLRHFLPFKEDSNFKQTKANLRKKLKKEPKKTQVVYVAFGKSYTQQVYSNPIIQNFVEFSLHYSVMKHVRLSAKEAKRVFEQACKVSFGGHLKNKAETQSFIDFWDFINGEKGFFNSTFLPTGKLGRKPGLTEDILKIEELAKQNKSNPQISEELEPTFKGSKRKAHIAHVGRTARRLGLPATKRQKIKK